MTALLKKYFGPHNQLEEVDNRDFSDGFGSSIDFAGWRVNQIIDQCENSAQSLLAEFYQASGLLVMRGLGNLVEQPEALVALSRLFGSEVENYHETLTSERFFHESVPEIIVLSNAPPCCHPPPPKPCGSDEDFPVQFPLRINWHTDQSYRRPPPDVTLLYSVIVPPAHQGQTLYTNCTQAYAELEGEVKELIASLQCIHAPSWIGRSREAVLAGEKPQALLDHQLPQSQPIVRYHPVTGRPALYLCEEKQLDYVDGPVAGLSPGPYGEGAQLVRKLLTHATQPHLVYIHYWQQGDLVIGDNRNQLHCATWYDSDKYSRLMWRTTVMGNPGVEYLGESKSWLPSDGGNIMQGMEHA